jgi:hypothetical protein
MTTKTTGDPAVDALYRARKGKVDFIDVPELGFTVVDGHGAPGGETFTNALQALYSVSYAAHFAVKKSRGDAPRVMPLEALWWIEGPDAQAIMEGLAAGDGQPDGASRDRWCWRAMIVQLAPIDEEAIAAAIDATAAKKDLPSLPDLHYERWAEGPSAQLMHIGPYAAEGTSIALLHAAITEHGARPRGRHHEIYLGDPRTAAPDKLRTILRQPTAPADLQDA